jgi:hypothetical protein
MPSKIKIDYAGMWPREVLYHGRKALREDPEFAILGKPGVYVLYREDVPFYVGQAKKNLRRRLWSHAVVSGRRLYNFWTHFSVLVPADVGRCNEIEAILIAAMPGTINSAKPRMNQVPFPKKAKELLKARRPLMPKGDSHSSYH